MSQCVVTQDLRPRPLPMLLGLISKIKARQLFSSVLGNGAGSRLTIVYRVVVLCFSLLFSIVSHSIEAVTVANFNEHGLDVFKQKVFDQKTDYQLVTIDKQRVLKAVADNSASALYRKIDINLLQTPFLNWSWRVENIYASINQKIKAGDDYPARIYVVFSNGPFPWQTRALNYVWSSNRDPDTYWPNPFTEKAVMIPLQQGSEGVGQWHHERVNVVEDYYRVFGEPVDSAVGVAIMSDSDNAGGRAEAYYGAITFSQ